MSEGVKDGPDITALYLDSNNTYIMTIVILARVQLEGDNNIVKGRQSDTKPHCF